MRWRRRGRFRTERPARPKTRRLSAEERDKLLAKMTGAINRSPVLRAFGVTVRTSRGRFYLDWPEGVSADDSAAAAPPASTWGRITPLDDPRGKLLLEVEFRRGRWSEIARGTAGRLIKTVASDTKGTFHGLGSLDKSLRQSEKQGLQQLKVRKRGARKFVYAETGEPCSVPEALHNYFGVPIPVVAEPRRWYLLRRSPHIVECSRDRSRVLVRFSTASLSGETFGGTCLYLKDEGRWGAYTIRPNRSGDIATAEAWLAKRQWKPWC